MRCAGSERGAGEASWLLVLLVRLPRGEVLKEQAVDEDVTAADFFTEALTYLRAGNTLVVWKLDR